MTANSRSIGFTLKTTEYVAKQINDVAISRGITQRALVLEGLRAIGLDIRDEDLTDRRGRPPKKKS
jgi:hypothetical protein